MARMRNTKTLEEEKKSTCIYCDKGGLVWRWDFRFKVNVLYETEGEDRGREHECEGRDMRPAKCRYCDTPGLVWIRRAGSKFELTEAYGLPHACPNIKKIYNDHKEALRINYALEKKWLKSIEDGYQCKRCDGLGYMKKTYRRCKKCKGIGTFSFGKKKYYLLEMRKKYWPYNSTWMKWKKAGS